MLSPNSARIPWDYSYDALRRLTRADRTVGAVTDVYLYEYDGAGNRTKKTLNGAATTYIYNLLNQLTTQVSGTDTTSYIYDAFGNQTEEKLNGTTERKYF